MLNVGAGTGSYEPAEPRVTAVEPSASDDLPARAPDAAPVVQASAEDLPFDDDSFDAAMAMITVHHWADLEAGLAEMARVARDRVVVLTFDPAPLADFWLVDYFPRAFEIHSDFMPPLERAGGGAGRRPGSRPCRSRAAAPTASSSRSGTGPSCSSTPRCGAPARSGTRWSPSRSPRGLAALRADLESGRWDERHGHLREETAELELGLRLLVAELG